ncbi:alpha/beta hydrolase [Allopusillimonas soli]|uniref:Alpha/beta hydrolase n=2 Tax=Allopusillimonas soli TaxID=659016 RepID=A0A853FC36_9BURK|nr:alpha/beta hydrolase [Allopusillimonas soli]TEA74879.1 alpha/beta hydrolase [Allopusillimonas soli]
MGYAPDELDRQYNARATVPDCMPFLQEYADYSAQAREEIPGVLDIQYGDHADETLDIFPALRAGAPVYVFIHGGYWRALSKDDSSFMAPAFVQAGATVVAVNYSLAPAAALTHIVDQGRRALAWIWKHIPAYNGDSERIHVSGSSAGGHLAGMLLAGGWHDAYGVPDSIVHSASPLSGLFDLRPLVHTHVNAWAELDEAKAIQLSPLFHLPSRGCPLLLGWGEHETCEFKRQSQAYAQGWQELGYPATQMEVPGTNHFNILMQLRQPHSALSRGILGLMGL